MKDLLGRIVSGLRSLSLMDIIGIMLLSAAILYLTMLKLNAYFAGPLERVAGTEGVLIRHEVSIPNEHTLRVLWHVRLPGGQQIEIAAPEHGVSFEPDATVCLGEYLRDGLFFGQRVWQLEKLGQCAPAVD